MKPGDEIYIQFGNGSLRVEVLELKETCRKEDAASMYRVIEYTEPLLSKIFV